MNDIATLQQRLSGDNSDIQTISPSVSVKEQDQTLSSTLTQGGVSQGSSTALQEPPSLIEKSYFDRLRDMAVSTDQASKTTPQTTKTSQTSQTSQKNTPASSSDKKWDSAFSLTNPKQQLIQIGYGALRYQRSSAQNGIVGGIADTYILGVGDQIAVTLRGEDNKTYHVTVDRDGRVTLPSLSPVAAAGRAFGDFRQDLQSQISSTMTGTNTFISLGSVRQVSVLVSGEVKSPGLVTVSGLSTVVDALARAQGVNKTGSLRQISLVRDGKTIPIDLYPVLLGRHATGDLALRDGDRIVVPPIGPTIAVLGTVSRPGIYEMRGDSTSLHDVMSWAGGSLTRTGNQVMKNTLGADGRARLVDMTHASKGSVIRGDIVFVERKSVGLAGSFELLGNVARPGWRSLGSTKSLRAILSDRSMLGKTPYLPFVVIRRLDPSSLIPHYLAVNGVELATGKADFALQDQDKVLILSLSDIAYLSSNDVLSVISDSLPSAPNLSGRSRLADRVMLASTLGSSSEGQAGQLINDSSLKNDTSKYGQTTAAQDVPQGCPALKDLKRNLSQNLSLISLPIGVTSSEDEQDDTSNAKQPTCPTLFRQYGDLLPFVLESVVSVSGAVQNPGLYPIISGEPVTTVLSAAGNLLHSADTSAVEVTNTYNDSYVRQKLAMGPTMASYKIAPFSVVMVPNRFTPLDGSTVLVRGEVHRPGRYVLFRGERLSQLIARAGGLTDQAYVLGSVFTRESVRKKEEESYQRLADELERAMPSAMVQLASMNGGDAASALSGLNTIIVSLRLSKAAGRIVVNADPAALAADPQDDVLLQGGDQLYIPKRPSHIMITGEVMHPGAQQFKSGVSAEDYINRAGGPNSYADDDRTFIILPNGEARPITVDFWNYKKTTLPPGSTIVVPRDLTPSMFWDVTKNALSIFSNMAVSAAALATINDD